MFWYKLLVFQRINLKSIRICNSLQCETDRLALLDLAIIAILFVQNTCM